MAPKTKAVNSLSGFLDSDDAQSDIEMMPTPDSNQENKPVAKASTTAKAPAARRGRPVAKRLSAGKPKTVKARAATKKRAPLKDQTNKQAQSDTEEVDDFPDQIEQEEVPASEAIMEEKAEPQPKKPTGRKGRPPKKAAAATVADEAKPTERDGEFEYTPTTARVGKKGPRGKTAAAKKQEESAIAETQQSPEVEDDDTMLSIEQDEPLPQSTYRPSAPARARSSSRQPPTYTTTSTTNARRRAGSASSTERANDPTLRRKLGDMTRKFESLELKYRNLRDVGIKEAETNFERLRKQSEDRTRAANDLISSLRSELAIQKDVNKEAISHASDLTATKANVTAAEARISELTSALTQAQNDNRNLQAKLTASRAASTTVEKVPGSAVKGRTPATKSMMGSAEAAHNLQIAQLKEDLYSDLTGLILRGVARGEEEDVYDCLQTGRNGTLHFKLTVTKDEAASYEDTEFSYTPRLDQNRDRDLIDILPDYLTEEITFSRVNAAKFYSRVVATLTRQVVDE